MKLQWLLSAVMFLLSTLVSKWCCIIPCWLNLFILVIFVVVNCYLEQGMLVAVVEKIEEEAGKIFWIPFDSYRLCKGFPSAVYWLEIQSTCSEFQFQGEGSLPEAGPCLVYWLNGMSTALRDCLSYLLMAVGKWDSLYKPVFPKDLYLTVTFLHLKNAMLKACVVQLSVHQVMNGFNGQDTDWEAVTYRHSRFSYFKMTSDQY